MGTIKDRRKVQLVTLQANKNMKSQQDVVQERENQE
jgi:hypothetical protein